MSSKYRRALDFEEESSGDIAGGGVLTLADDALPSSLSAGQHNIFDSAAPNSIGDGGIVLTVANSKSHDRSLPASRRFVRFWHSRTDLERALLVLCCILVVLAFILIIVLCHLRSLPKTKLVSVPTNYTYVYEQNVCLTPACVKASSKILEYVDTTADPCEDFYQFACGGWVETRDIPMGYSSWSTFMEMNKMNELIVKKSLEEPLNRSESQAEMKSKIFYESCLNISLIKQLDAQPLLDLLKSLGGWPLVKSIPSKILSMQEIFVNVYSVTNIMLLPVFSFRVDADAKNVTENIISFDQNGLGLYTRDYYLNKTKPQNEKVLSAYRRLMRNLGIELGIAENSTWYEDVIELETKLASIFLSEDDRREILSLYNKVTVKEFDDMCPPLSILNLLRSQFQMVDIDIQKDREIVLFGANYFRNVCALIQEYNANETSRNIFRNYAIWLVVRELGKELSPRFQNIYLAFNEEFRGVKGSQELWRECVTKTQELFGMPIGAMFVRKVFRGDSKATAHRMINEIKKEFGQNLNHVSWMDADTRSRAKNKAEKIEDMIGFPEYILNATALDEEFTLYNISVKTYFNNVLNAYKAYYLTNLKRLDEKVVQRWDMSPQMINAYYKPTKNQIFFPAGILQPPFYDKDYPKSLNYGAIGVVMGHEITHGFDDQGCKFDAEGNLRNWWNNQTVVNFETRSVCMQEQYSGYSMYGEQIRGKQTLGENIADNGGLKAAYLAFKSVEETDGVDKMLPAINMTQDQLFFTSFAQIWCRKARKQAVIFDIKSDPHTPDEYRVLGTLSNSADFAKVFHCPSNSKMNPTKKCVVW